MLPTKINWDKMKNIDEGKKKKKNIDEDKILANIIHRDQADLIAGM